MVRTRGGIKRHSVGEASQGAENPPSSEIPIASTSSTDSGPSAPSAVSGETRPKQSKSDIDISQPRLYRVEEAVKLLTEEPFIDEEVDMDIDDDEGDLLGDADFAFQDSESEDSHDSEASQAIIQTPSAPQTNDPSQRIWARQPPTDRPDSSFQLTPGLKMDTSNLKTPRDFMDLLLTDELINHIVTQTNLYAQDLLSKATQPKALIRKWKPLDVAEFLIFLGLLYHMGTIQLNKLTDYWSTDPILFGITCFRRVMTRDRFFGILQTLHFAKNPDPSEPTPTDKLYKIRPLIDIFHRTMDSIIIPTKNLTIDESMVLWRGRLIFRQYIANKSHPYGIKLYMLNESSGLVLRFIVYAGSSDQETGGKGHASKVVNKLMDGKTGVGHSLFMDNFYNSVNLVHELLEKNTFVTGTLRKNRVGNPPEVTNAKPKKGEVVDFYSDKGVCVLNWKDKREVLMISSEFSGQMVDVTNRRGIVVRKPEMVQKYNESMGGVDHFDQMMAYYPVQRKTLKWTKKMGIHILHLCMYNAFTLHNKYKPKMALYDFRNSVIRSFLPPINVPPSVSRPQGRPGRKGLSEHYPTMFDKVEGTNRMIRKRCRVCLSKGVRKEISCHCPACPEKPALCQEECFKIFHKDMFLY